MFRFLLLASLVLAPALTRGADISVNARFNPPRVALGNPVRYIVEIVETGDSGMPQPETVDSLPIPNAGNLSLRNGRTSTSSQTRILNGEAEYTATQRLIIDAVPPRPGEFTIPAFSFPYKGQTLRAPSATLQVLERGEDAGPSAGELIFLKADIPGTLYLGQTVPIDLKLYISDRARLGDLTGFDKTADGFTLSELPDRPQDGNETIDGRRYRVLRWPMALTPIRSGAQDIGFQFSLVASLPGENTRRDPFGRRSPFGSSIFDDFFDRGQRLNVYTEPKQIRVKPLPARNQPAAFSGAIGDFNLQVFADAESARVGEPVMLSVEVSGEGNFDRIQGPPLEDTDTWKFYEPESAFEARDALGLRGTKRFDYVAVPQKPGRLEIPPVHFAFFDPEAERYVELESPPIPIQVAASATPAPPGEPSTRPDMAEPQEASPQNSEEALLSLDDSPSQSRRIDANPLTSPWFYTANTVALLGLAAAAFVLHRRKRLRTDTDFALLQAAAREEKQAKAEAARAATQDERDHFFRCAQQALRCHATHRTGRDLRNAELHRVEQAFRDLGATEEQRNTLRTLFETGDAIRFSGRAAATDLPTAKAQLDQLLKLR